MYLDGALPGRISLARQFHVRFLVRGNYGVRSRVEGKLVCNYFVFVCLGTLLGQGRYCYQDILPWELSSTLRSQGKMP